MLQLPSLIVLIILIYVLVTITYSSIYIYFDLDKEWDKNWDGDDLPPIPFSFAKYLWFITMPFQLVYWFFRLINYLSTYIPLSIKNRQIKIVTDKKAKEAEEKELKSRLENSEPKRVRIFTGDSSYRNNSYVDLIKLPSGMIKAEVNIDGKYQVLDESQIGEQLFRKGN